MKLKILFVYQVASFWPSWDSLYRNCMEDDAIEVKLFRIGGEQGDHAQMDHSEDFLIKNGIPYEEFTYEKVMAFNPVYMIYQTPYDKGHRPVETWTARFRSKGIRICYIPYGIEISDTEESRYKHFLLSVVLNAFAVFVLSDEMRAEYEKHCVNAKAVRAYGLPRFDMLLEPRGLPESYRDKVKGRKIVLWKLHFPKVFIENGVKKQATPDLDEYIKFLDYIKKAQDLFFIFMPHPKFADSTIDAELLPKAQYLLNELQKIENVYIDMDDDYRASLVNAKAIIIDRSAIMVEAGVKNVPVLYMYNENYREPMIKPIQNLLDSYYQGTIADDMIRFCEKVRNGEDDNFEIRKKAFNKCVPYLDGKSAGRIKAYLMDAAETDMETGMVSEIPKNSRIVFFGAGYIGMFCLDSMEKKLEIVAFADNDKTKWNKSYMGYPVVSPEMIKQLQFDYLVLASDKYYREIYFQICSLGIPMEKVVNFDHFIVLTQRWSG